MKRRKDRMGWEQNPSLTRRSILFQILRSLNPERLRKKREQESPQNWWREYLRSSVKSRRRATDRTPQADLTLPKIPPPSPFFQTIPRKRWTGREKRKEMKGGTNEVSPR